MKTSISQTLLSDILLRWYDRHARDLPWRAPPGTKVLPDPYHVWLSEVMLQQTTVAAVKPYFLKFTQKWRDVRALAAAEEEDVMAAWAGLGYYSRARNLVRCAREVAELGAFPETEEELRALPGLGSYTAAAVAAIAFGRRAVVIDANVERVAARLFRIESPLPGARKPIREAMERITPDERSGDFAQGMMDLGSSICTARDPKCLICPLSDHCCAKQSGDPARLPIKPPKKPKPERTGQAYWIEQSGKVWLVRREGKGMLGGMRGLPDDGWSAREDGSQEPPFEADWRDCGAVTHVFTHARLTLSLFASVLPDNPPTNDPKAVLGNGQWWPIDRLEEAGLPTLFAKAAARVIASR